MVWFGWLALIPLDPGLRSDGLMYLTDTVARTRPGNAAKFDLKTLRFFVKQFVCISIKTSIDHSTG